MSVNRFEARARAVKAERIAGELRARLPEASAVELFAVARAIRLQGGGLLREVAELAGVRLPSDRTLVEVERVLLRAARAEQRLVVGG